jgi:hypothetical protein
MPLLNPVPTRFLSQITRHIERTVGRSPMVFHEIISADIHLDLYIVPPTAAGAGDRAPAGNCYTIVTSGMSTRPMPLPVHADPETPRFAELLINLPADWPGLRRDGTIVNELMHEENNWWPFRWLKMIARLPYENDEWIGAGQIIPNIPEGRSFASATGFAGMLLLPSVVHPKSQRLVVHDDTAIEFLALWPLFPEEIKLHRRAGLAALQAAFARCGVTDLIDVHRPNVATAG